MYTAEQLHPDVIEEELGPEGMDKAIKALSDDDTWDQVANMHGDVWTLGQINRFMELAATFEQALSTEVKVFHRNYYGLELRRKKTYRELVDRAVQLEKYRRQTANREEAEQPEAEVVE